MDTVKMADWRMFLCILLLFLVNYCVIGFNIDTNIPVIKMGKPGSYFGYSSLTHQIFDDNQNVKENVLLVAAPLADAYVVETRSGVTEEVKGHGTLHKCPLTTLYDDCARIKDAMIDRYDATSQNTTGQWLGVALTSRAVDSDMPKVMVCAHRFKAYSASTSKKKENNWGVGRCYDIDNKLTFQMAIQECKDFTGDYKTDGYCLMGTSAAISEEGKNIAGAPSSWNNAGKIFAVDEFMLQASPSGAQETDAYLGYATTSGRYMGVNKHEQLVASAPNSPTLWRSKDKLNKDALYSGAVLLFKTKYDTIKEEDRLEGSGVGSMFGFSLCTVDLNADGYDDLLVGAPYYFEKHKLIGGAVYIYYGSDAGVTSATKPQIIYSRTMDEKDCETLECTHAQFGYSIASIGDVNRDGYKDVAISAPYEGDGAVYIFHGHKGKINANYSQRIEASQIPSKTKLTTFGSSLSGRHDLDNNGYPDLLIGAYQSDAVVFLRARPIIKLYSRFNIEPKKLNPLDVEKGCQFNNTIKQQCIKLELCLSFTTDPPNKFHSKVIVKYKIKGYKYPGASTSRIEFQNHGSTPDTLEREVPLDKQSTDPQQCFEEIAYLQKKFSDKQRPLKFMFNFDLQEQKIPVLTPGDPLPSISDYPILDAESAMHAAGGPDGEHVVDVTFINDCNGQICRTDLKLDILVLLPRDNETNIPVLSIGKDDRIDLNVTLFNQKEAAYETKFYVTLPDALTFSSVVNPEDALPVSCRYPVVVDNVTHIACIDIGNPLGQNDVKTFQIRLTPVDLQKPSGEVIQLQAFVNTTSTELNNDDNIFVTPIKVITQTDMIVTGTPSPEQVIYGGEVVGESAIRNVNDIGREVNHTYTVLNTGPGIVQYSTLYIHWPYELSGAPHGKHLLYLLGEPTSKESVLCYVKKPETIDPAGILERQKKAEAGDYTTYERRRREVDQKTDTTDTPKGESPRPPVTATPIEGTPRPPIAYSEGGKTDKAVFGKGFGQKKLRDVIELNCAAGSGVKCVEIRCEIEQMGPGDKVSVVVNSRLWKSTFLQEYRDVEGVRIVSNARITIDPHLKITQNASLDTATAETLAIPDIKIIETQQGVEWWVIFIAVIGGILLLVLVIVILWKCGFFKRKTYGSIATHECKVEKQKEPLD